ncbi:outer membrane beta-barrel protein [Sandarakinorhabdus sp. AAP62]|uniref:outer membrane protein n=1 Tax=Sandarakinorhabdus sp. AAP62 TaxID=1248916 RepID=UPI00030BD993|nr:outer membrane beta-barrel protein [Sandarakinorhabdus sp. AAP62]
MTTKFRSALLALAVATTAIAAPAAAESFNGPFVGITAGYNHDKVGPGLEGAAPLNRSTDQDAAVFGINAGYDKLIARRFVIGAEAAFSIGADDTLAGTRGTTAVSIDPKHAFEVSARAGYLVTEKALLYVRGGYANVRVRTSTAAAASSDNLDAWLAGGGIEYAVTRNINARLEYRYIDAASKGATFERQQVLLGASYRF